MKKLLSAVSVLLLTLAGQSNLYAAIIPNVSVLLDSSEVSASGDSRSATNLVNGTGLFGTSHTYVPEGAMWLTSDTTPGAYSNAFVTFDLGAVYKLNRIKFYNYNEATTTSTGGTSNGVQNADVLLGTVQDTYTATTNITLSKAPGTFTDFSQTVNFGDVMARYVKINVNTNWGSSSNRAGLSKVLFIDTNVMAAATSATVNWLSNSVTVWFSEGVIAATATNPANYTIKSAADTATITGIAMGANNDSVILQTSALTNGAYNIGITNVAVISDGSAISNSLPVQTQLAIWLKGDVGVITNSGGVTTWQDQSGNGNDASQTNTANQPGYTASDINGLPSVKFTSLHFMDVPYSSTISGTRDACVIAVMKVTAKGNNCILSRASVNRAAPIDYRFTSTAVICYRGNDQGSGTFSSSTGTGNFAVNTPTLVAVNEIGTNCIHYLNGLLNGNSTLLLGVRDSQNVTRIAGRADNGESLAGSLSELMVFRTGISADDRIAINGYLGAKYGLTISDLGFTTQPKSATVLEGQTASFSAVATASSTNAITYQWQTNGVNITGATKTSYTTPLLTLADNNELFTVIATSGLNKATSTVATLLVGIDTIAPTLIYAGTEIWNSNNVTVVFSKSVSPATATTLANYSLDGGATVTAAVMGGLPNKVILTVTPGATQVTVQNIQDLFGNGISASSAPIGLYPQISLWLRADLGVMTDGGGNVLEWDDQSGNANNVMGSAIPPTLITGLFNGQPAMHFDGTNNFFAALSSGTLAVTGDLSVYTVVRYTDFSNPVGTEIISKTGGTGNNIPQPFDYYAAPDNGQMRYYRGNGGTGGSGVSYLDVTSTPGISAGVLHAMGVSQTGSAVVHFLDGLPNGTGTMTVQGTDAGAPVGIGSRNDLMTKMKGEIAELMLFSVGLDSTDRAALDTMLGTKYGVTIRTPAVPSPKLTFAAINGNSLVISWPVPASTFLLESTTNLANTNSWTPVANTTNTVAGTNSVTVSTTGALQFFRLQLF